jgi:hypothetical protein
LGCRWVRFWTMSKATAIAMTAVMVPVCVCLKLGPLCSTPSRVDVCI